MVIWVGLTGTE